MNTEQTPVLQQLVGSPAYPPMTAKVGGPELLLVRRLSGHNDGLPVTPMQLAVELGQILSAG